MIGVPDSSTPAAIGYALESGLPFTEGLTKNRYIGRTFIAVYTHSHLPDACAACVSCLNFARARVR